VRHAIAGAKVAAAALMVFAVPLGTIFAIVLGPLDFQYLGMPSVVSLFGVAGVGLALVAVIRARDPAFAGTIFRYSLAATAIAIVAITALIASQPPNMDPLGAIPGAKGQGPTR
jgi:hypothetical protein